MTESPAPAPGRTRAWPLLVFASLSFVPGLGFFLGVAAICWGLVSSRPRALWGVAIGATGMLLHVAWAVYLVQHETARHPAAFTQAYTELARRDLATLVDRIEAYHERYGAYPPSLPVLQQASLLSLHPVNIYDQAAGSLIPRLYQYRLAPDGRTYDLFSVGRDGKPGTVDDIRPVLPDSVRSRAGFRPPP